MSKTPHNAVIAFLAANGKKGGKSTSPGKVRAAKDNVKKALAARLAKAAKK